MQENTSFTNIYDTWLGPEGKKDIKFSLIAQSRSVDKPIKKVLENLYNLTQF
jgi:hypothetical protein